MATVRSVTARLEANVDGYIRDMRRAGRETDQAFASMVAGQRNLNQEFARGDIRTQKLTTSVRDLRTELRGARTDSGQFVEQTRRGTGVLGMFDRAIGRTDARLADVASTSVRAGAGLDAFGRGVRDGGNEIDQFSGRLRIGLDLLSTLGPSIIPLSGLAATAVAGLATQLTVATGAGITAVLAFQGVGDALGAIEQARLEPTVANLEAAQVALGQLTPAARDFATQLGSMRAEISASTVGAAAEGLFPGLTRSLDDLDALLPRARSIFGEIGDAVGDLTADSAESLASPRWAEFFGFLEAEARPTLTALYGTVGDLTHGLAELLMATNPLADDFTGWLRDAASDFDNWATGLDQTEGFREFVAYIRQNGPQVAETGRAIGAALVDITTAAAPLGGPALAALEAVARVISVIADSPIGTPLLQAVAAMALFNRTAAATKALLGGAGLFGTTRANVRDFNTSLGGTTTGLSRMGRAAAGVAATATAVSLLGNALAEATGANVDTKNLNRDIEALANGATPELLDQVGDSLAYMAGWQNKAAEPIREVATGFGLLGNTSMDNAVANIDAVDQTLAALVESGNAEQAEQAFQRIAESMTGLPEGASIAPWMREDLLSNFGAYSTALDNAAASNDEYAGSAEGAGEAASGTSVYINQLAQAMRAQTEVALGAFSAQTAWGQAVADAQELAEQGARGINAYTEAGRENRTGLEALAGAWNAQGNAVKNNEDRYRDARRTFLDTAEAMGVGADRARNLANQLLDMPKSVVIRLAWRGMREAIGDGIQLGGIIGDLDGRGARPDVRLNGADGAIRTGVRLGGIIGDLDNDSANPEANVRDNASGPIAAIQARLNGLTSKTITIETIIKTTRIGVDLGGAIGTGGADGLLVLPSVRRGPYEAFAMGGVSAADRLTFDARDPMDRANGHPAHVAASGTARVFREEETGGEAYVPLRDDVRRPRAKRIIEEVVDRFNGDVEWYARGGVRDRDGDGDERGKKKARPIPIGPGDFGDWRRERREDRAQRAREHKELLRALQRQTPGDQTAKELKQLASQYREFQRNRRERIRDRREDERTLTRGIRDFAPDPTDGVDGVRSSLGDLRRAVRESGGEWTKAMRRQAEAMVETSTRYDAVSEALDTNRDRLEEATRAYDDYKGGVRDSFNGEIFGNGLAGLELQLNADANDSDAMLAAIRQATEKGLDGGLAEALYASKDLDTAQQLAALDEAGIARYEELFARRAAAQEALGTYAADQIYGPAVKEFTAVVAANERTMEELRMEIAGLGDRLERAVERGSGNGVRNGMGDRDRVTGTMASTGYRRGIRT